MDSLILQNHLGKFLHNREDESGYFDRLGFQ